MNLKDYAQDVEKSIEEIKKLCDKIGISYDDEESLLTEEDIILLDNEIQDNEDYIADEEDMDYEEEVEDKAEALAQQTRYDLDNNDNFQKLKSRSVKKAEAKSNFIKERKKIYKHREKLQSNEVVKDDNVILYKENMTISELAEALNVAGVELVKKAMA